MTDILATAHTIVVKVGSSLLIDAKTGSLRRDWLKSLSADIAQLKSEGKEVLLVSSGAIALGRRALKLKSGVLKLEARVAIHFVHRLGAVVATTLLLLVALRTLWQRRGRNSRYAAIAVLAALVLQLGIGIEMVLRGFPLWIATAHNAGAALLLLSTLALNRALRRA